MSKHAGNPRLSDQAARWVDCLICHHSLEGHDFYNLASRLIVPCSACPNGECRG